MKQKKPFFSIIIPTCNRPMQLKSCLNSLCHLNYPRDRFEVIVVDDGSDEPLTPIVKGFQNQFNLSLIRQKNTGPAGARNTGAGHAKGAFLAFTDDDCASAPDWLQRLAECFDKTPDSAVGGKTVNVLYDNLYAVGSQMLVDYLYAYYNANPARAKFLTSNNLALPTDRFRSLAGFDTSFPRAAGEDREFCARWLYFGNRIIYAPEALVYHAHGLTFHTFFRQHFNYGRGAYHFHQMCSQRSQKHKHRQPSGFYTNLLCYPLYHSFDHSTFLIALLFIITQIANTAGYFWERIKQR